jgi:hypothetical protein
MRKILFILFLFPLIVSGQFSILSTSRGFFNNATVTIGSASYTAGVTTVFFVATTVSLGTPTDNPTVSSGSLTLNKLGTITWGSNRIIAYMCIPAANTTTSITFTYAEAQAQHFYGVYNGTTGELTGTTAVAATATSTDPSITLPSKGNSHVIAYFFNNTNPVGGTAEAGWTEDFDAGNAIPNGHAGYHRNSTSDNTVQVTAASSTWGGIAVQFHRRRIINCQ